MHRAARKAFRTTSTQLSAVRSLSRAATRPPRRTLFTSPSRFARRPQSIANEPLRSSMYFRRLPAALVSSIVVGYGAWYSYNATNVPGGQALHSFNSRQGANVSPGDAAPTRTVLVVDADQLRQGTIVGEGPILKPTDSDGRRIVEMLTPEQATHKLRRLEKSVSVHRGEGVTRYDVVQLPSNDPIEDDHDEKIVKVPAPADGAAGASSDWMFWGVFDGHS